MPVYEWKGIDAAGKKKKGLVDAENQRQAKDKLKKSGVFLTDINEAGQDEISPTGEKRSTLSRKIDLSRFISPVSASEVTVVTRLMANLIAANIPMVETLTAIVDQVDNPAFKKVLSQIRERVNEGSSLSDAMAEHGKLFPPIYTNMIRAGESSGALDIVMNRLADYSEAQMALRGKITSAMFYPILMFVFAVLVVGVLFTVVIPKLSMIFEHARIALPLSTRILIGLSSFVARFWWLIFLGIGTGSYFFRKWKNSPKGREKWDAFVLRAPLFGGVVRIIAVSRFARTLSTLLSSGVPLLTALDIVKSLLNNKVLEKVLEETRNEIREGESIAVPLKRSGQFPPIVTHMIAVGEKSGQLEEMLNHVSRTYDIQVENRINALTSLITPLMTIAMGLVVAFIVVSVLLPIMQINQSFK